jgi:cell division protein FtsI/penicillin-binding protein 2
MALTPIGVLYLASLVNLISWSLPDEDPDRTQPEDVTGETIIAAERGAILDRHGLVLAEDRCTWNLVVNYLPEHRGLIVGMEDLGASSLTPEDVVERVQILADGTGYPFEDLWHALMVNPDGEQVLRRGLTLAEREFAMQAFRRVPSSGLSLQQEFSRVYPNGRVLSHVIGLVGDKGKPDKEGEKSDDRPNSGFEAGLNDLLAGTPGVRHTIRVSGKHGVDLALDNVEAQAGQSVRTSLDLELSQYAHGQLTELQQEHEPWRCFALAIEIETGQILLMEGLPDYDSNNPLPSLTTKADPYSGEDKEFGWVNPAMWNFEPGSTMKPLVAAYALERGDISEEQRFERFGGKLYLPRRLRRDVIEDTGTMPPGDYRAFEGIVESSNIVFAQIARTVGREGMADILDFYGYHDKKFEMLGLDQPFMPRFSVSRAKIMRERGPDGMAYTVPTMGYGQGFDVPPIDHAMAIASIANGGTLLEATFNPNAEAKVRDQIFSADTSAYVREAMLGMVKKEHRKWLPHRDELDYCGKSGTAMIRGGPFLEKYTSSFVCYGPYEDPEVLVLVVAYGTSYHDRIGTHHFGSKVAGPAAANILYRALELRGSLPTNGNGGLDWDASPANLDR